MVFSKCTDRTYGKKSEWGFNERDHLDTFILGGNYSRGDLISRSCSRARNQFIRKFRAKNPCVLHRPCFHLVGMFDYFVDHEEERNHASSITRRYSKPNQVNAVKRDNSEPFLHITARSCVHPRLLGRRSIKSSRDPLQRSTTERASEERMRSRDLEISVRVSPRFTAVNFQNYGNEALHSQRVSPAPFHRQRLKRTRSVAVIARGETN